jgi:multidrug resistance efflux pump
MDASLVPVSLPTRNSFVARTVAGAAPPFLIAGVAVYLLARESGVGTTAARGFSEAVPLNVAPSVAGRLVQLNVALGQTVKAGDILGKLDGSALEIDKKRAEAEHKLLEAKLMAETSREDDVVMRAEVWRLRTVAGSQQDQAALSALDKELERLNSLLDDQLVKASDVEPRRREREALAARVQTFDKAKAAGQAGLDPRNVKGSDQRRAIVQLRMAPLREAIKVKEAEIAQIDYKLSMLNLRAPADGQVSLINRRPGEVVALGEAAIVIVVHRPGIFIVYIPERQTRMPNVGDSVDLTRRGVFKPGASGRVVEVGPDIVEVPPRLRSSPQVPVWGRRVVVDASASESMRSVPAGEEVRVRL